MAEERVMLLDNCVSGVWSNESISYYNARSGAFDSVGLSTSRENENETMWAKVVNSLTSMYSLLDDWDGEGAESPNQLIIDSVFNLLGEIRDKNIALPERIVPTQEGGVLLEWQRGGDYMELDVIEPNLADLMLVKNGQEPVQSEFRW